MKKIILATAICIFSFSDFSVKGMSQEETRDITADEVDELCWLVNEVGKQYDDMRTLLEYGEFEAFIRVVIDRKSNIDRLVELRTLFGYSSKDILSNLRILETLRQLFLDDLYKATREPKLQETKAVNSLVSFIERCSGIKINKVVIFDEFAKIRQLGEDQIKKDAKKLLRDQKEDDISEYIFQHIENFDFTSNSPIYFQEKIKGNIAEGNEKSKKFRDVVVSVIAEQESTRTSLPVFFGLKSDKQLSFSDDNWCFYKPQSNTIGFNSLQANIRTRFCTSRAVKQNKDDSFLSSFIDFQNIFHEMGHSLFCMFTLLNEYVLKVDETLSMFSTMLQNIDTDRDAIDNHFELLESAPEEVQQEYLLIRHSDCNNLEEAKTQVLLDLQTKEGIAKLLFDDATEIFQIFGLELIKYRGEYTLFINLLSDLALSAECGFPIRADHTSIILNPNDSVTKFLCPSSPFVYGSLPLEFYGIMLELVGSDMQQYALRVIYGDKLTLALENEWNLAKKCLK